MSHLLKFGAASSIRFDSATNVVDRERAPNCGKPLADVAAAVAAAVEDPLDFPPLSAATVPGDEIVLALDDAVPQAAQIVAGIVHVLQKSNQAPGITIVCDSAPDSDQDPRALLPDEVRESVALKIHDSDDTRSLAFLAAGSSGEPIYLNRTICDADVVIPVSTVCLEDSPGYVGVYGGLFPAFSDRATQERFTQPGSTHWVDYQRQRREESNEAAWLLGVQFALQVVPGTDEGILHVLAGDAQVIAAKGRELCQAAWSLELPKRADLVVAAIAGGPRQQTWENLARALFAASQVVDDNGAILICSELQEKLPQEMKTTWEDDGHDQTAVDTISSRVIDDIRERYRLYLLSGLDSEAVEDVGMAYVADADEVARLARRSGSCILIPCAQFAVPSSVAVSAG